MNHQILDAMAFVLTAVVSLAVGFIFGAIDPTFHADVGMLCNFIHH